LEDKGQEDVEENQDTEY